MSLPSSSAFSTVILTSKPVLSSPDGGAHQPLLHSPLTAAGSQVKAETSRRWSCRWSTAGVALVTIFFFTVSRCTIVHGSAQRREGVRRWAGEPEAGRVFTLRPGLFVDHRIKPIRFHFWHQLFWGLRGESFWPRLVIFTGLRNKVTQYWRLCTVDEAQARVRTCRRHGEPKPEVDCAR